MFSLLSLARSADQVGSISVSRSCQTKITAGQVLAVSKPLLLSSPVEATCPFADKGDNHLDACDLCAVLHSPCQDETFSACEGCCHVPLFDHKGRPMNSTIQCPHVQEFFRRKNSVNCSLRMRMPSEESDETVEDVGVVVKEPTFHGGTIEDVCSTPKTKMSFLKTPLMIDFQCGQCDGTPTLLQKCCDECKRFSMSEKLAKKSLIQPFVVCHGCDVKEIKTRAGMQPWKSAGNYNEFSQKFQSKAMDDWVENNICTLVQTKSCEHYVNFDPMVTLPFVTPVVNNSTLNGVGRRLKVRAGRSQSGFVGFVANIAASFLLEECITLVSNAVMVPEPSPPNPIQGSGPSPSAPSAPMGNASSTNASKGDSTVTKERVDGGSNLHAALPATLCMLIAWF